jgi:hypothetical protein
MRRHAGILSKSLRFVDRIRRFTKKIPQPYHKVWHLVEVALPGDKSFRGYFSWISPTPGQTRVDF